MNPRHFLRSLSLTGFVFGLAGWLYIVLNSEVHPWTLPRQLTHFASWPREDTFGEACFAIALVSFFIYQLIKGDPDNHPRR